MIKHITKTVNLSAENVKQMGKNEECALAGRFGVPAYRSSSGVVTLVIATSKYSRHSEDEPIKMPSRRLLVSCRGIGEQSEA